MTVRQLVIEQRNLLRMYGFDNGTLGFGSAEEHYVRQLHLALTQKMASANVPDIDMDFRVDITGLFDQERDLVNFQFHYRLDPVAPSLSLQKITARMGDTRLDFNLGEGRQLPNSQMIYEALHLKRTRQPIQENTELTSWRRRL